MSWTVSVVAIIIVLVVVVANVIVGQRTRASIEHERRAQRETSPPNRRGDT